MQTLKILLLSFILIINCFAQQKDTLSSLDKPVMSKWAVQFQVGSNFTIQSLEGVTVSLKYHFSQKFALRAGIGGNFRKSDNEIDYRGYYYHEYVKGPYEQQTAEIVLTSNALYYPKPGALLKLFFGAGPRYSYARAKGEYLYLDGYKDEYHNTSWSAGLNAVLGCEWMPVKFLGLFGEYSAYGVYSESVTKEYIYEIETEQPAEYYYRTTNEIQLKGNIVRLGLSLYF